MIDGLLLGLSIATSLSNILWCFTGVFLGTIVGVLPGLGPMAAISILLPITFSLGDPITAIIFIAGIFYGTQYGGSTTSILLNLPGEPASVVTAVDGYSMTKKGRGGAALAIAAIGSFIAGTFATIIIGVLAEPLSDVVFLFGPTEYAALMILGLLASVTLSDGSLIKGIGMIALGLMIGMIGTDVNSGTQRFDFSMIELGEGISFAVLAIGVFGLSEIIYESIKKSNIQLKIPRFRDLYPSKEEFKKSVPAIFRGTLLGSFLGILPGTGSIISSFASYALEKKVSKNPEQFGKGAIEGVAGPESANNAASQTSFIPVLSIGIPTTPVMSLVISALLIYGIQPGPQIINENPELFWGLIVSMWIGNLFLLILNLPLVGIWIRLLSIPKYLLYGLILIACIIGTYYIGNNWFNVWLLIPFTILGIVLKYLEFNPAPLALGFVIGPMLEEYTRRTLTMSNGNWSVFLDKPISLTLLVIAISLIIGSIIIKNRDFK